MEEQIRRLIEEKGPLTGSEICAVLEEDELKLWRACRLSERLMVQTIGRRYLRLDRAIEGFARLSPSILREFLTYSVIGLRQEPQPVYDKAAQVESHIQAVSKSKLELSRTFLSALLSQFEYDPIVDEQACFIVAGDVVYGMSHDVPRRERSTGKLVKGSDIDLVVVVDDSFPKASMERMDEAIYQEKQKLLLAPHVREEIDYIVKDLSRVRDQLAFDTFKHMVACKILEEGILVHGSAGLFRAIKTMLQDRGVTEELKALEERAKGFREEAERCLLIEGEEGMNEKNLCYFYPTAESEEFE